MLGNCIYIASGLTADASLYLHQPVCKGMGEIKAVASGQLEFSISVIGLAPDTTEPDIHR